MFIRITPLVSGLRLLQALYSPTGLADMKDLEKDFLKLQPKVDHREDLAQYQALYLADTRLQGMAVTNIHQERARHWGWFMKNVMQEVLMESCGSWLVWNILARMISIWNLRMRVMTTSLD